MPAAAVTCAYCHAAFAPAAVDLAPLGWRCGQCKLAQEIDIHGGFDEESAHLGIAGMEAKVARLRTAMIGTVALAIVGVVVMIAGSSSSRVAARAFGATLAACGAAIWELVAWRRARRTVAALKARASDAA